MKQVFILWAIAALAGCFDSEGSVPEKTGMEGKPLPEFNLLLTDSTTWINTRNIPSGKPTVLFYFSPTCSYCRAQTEEIIEDMDKLKNMQFYFITHKSLTGLKNFCKEFELARYKNITIGVDTGHIVSDYFEIEGVPYTAIFNKNKKLNKSYLGKIYSSQIIKAAKE